MKNILLIIPELNRGGAEKSLLKLSKILAGKYNVSLCVFHTHVVLPYPPQVNLIDLCTPPTSNWLKKMIYFIIRLNAIKKIKIDSKIDVSISFLEGADYINILSKRNEKVIISIRGSKIFDKEIKGLVGLLRKKVLIPVLYKRADRIVTVSQGLEQELVQSFNLEKEKILTIPNFFDIDTISDLASEALPDGLEKLYEVPVIVNVGRLHPQKGQKSLLKIFANLKDEIPCRLLIIGEGPLKENLIEYAQNLGLTVADNSNYIQDGLHVYFMNYQKNPFKYVKRSKVFAFTSLWEGFPNALVEAMITGTITVSTDCVTGPREILSPNNSYIEQAKEPEETALGWLMPIAMENDSKSIDYWTRILKRCLEEDMNLKTSAASKQIRNYSEEVVSGNWIGIVE